MADRRPICPECKSEDIRSLGMVSTTFSNMWIDEDGDLHRERYRIKDFEFDTGEMWCNDCPFKGLPEDFGIGYKSPFVVLCISGTEDGDDRSYFIGFYPDEPESLEKAIEDFDPYGLFRDENMDMGKLESLTYFKLPKYIADKLGEIDPYSGSVVDAACGRTLMKAAQQFLVGNPKTIKVDEV